MERRLSVCIWSVLYEGLDKMTLWESSRVKLGSASEFMKVELDGDEACNSFESIGRRSSECT